MPEFKTYFCQLTEHNGERDYLEDYLIEATDLEDAEKQAHEYAKNYFCENEEPKYLGDGQYEYYGGQYILEIGSIMEMSRDEFIETLLTGRILNYHIN